MAAIEDLQNGELIVKKGTLYLAQAAYNTQLKETERLYESLLEFKTVVVKSQEQFYEANSAEKKTLEPVATVMKNSLIAKEYYGGMKGIINPVGTAITTVMYAGLIISISSKLKEYVNDIAKLEESITKVGNEIADIERKIDELEKKKQDRESFEKKTDNVGESVRYENNKQSSLPLKELTSVVSEVLKKGVKK